MTTELEQEFFNVFGIEPYISCNTGFIAHYKGRSYVCDAKTCKKCKSNKKVYPEITDRKLLEMICIANKANIEVIGETVEETKNKLLEEMVYWKDDVLYKEIQQLFKEEE